MTGSSDLAGKVFLVTGASSGIGAHAAEVFTRAGARVALLARREVRLNELAERLRTQGGTCTVCAADVTQPAAVDGAFDRAEAQLGPVDVVFNNAGIGGPAVPAIDVDKTAWDATLATNLSAPFFVAQTFAKRAIARQAGGAILNVASIVGIRAGGSLSAYASSKAGLIHLTRVLALEWARYGIRVNALAPGYIRTELNDEFLALAGESIAKRIPQRRLGTLADLDGALLFLCSQASGYITGAVLPVDGGHLVSSL